VPGIDLPARSLADLRTRIETAAAELSGDARLLVFGCDHGVDLGRLASPGLAALKLPCIAALPPAFIDYLISRDLADGVVLAGCREGACYYRFGAEWTQERIERRRDPYLRARVPRERLCTIWAAPTDRAAAERALRAFATSLESLPPDLGRTPQRATPAKPQIEELSDHG
jgi:coenzyme F420-reducing hydrogenase delta subunit